MYIKKGTLELEKAATCLWKVVPGN